MKINAVPVELNYEITVSHSELELIAAMLSGCVLFEARKLLRDHKCSSAESDTLTDHVDSILDNMYKILKWPTWGI